MALSGVSNGVMAAYGLHSHSKSCMAIEEKLSGCRLGCVVGGFLTSLVGLSNIIKPPHSYHLKDGV